MTAEEKLVDQFDKDGIGSPPRHVYESITKAMNEYARFIAEKAVDEYKKESLTGTWFAPSITCDEILSRIKTLTEE